MTLPRARLLAIAVPLTLSLPLGLAACKGKDDGVGPGPAASSTPLGKIAPPTGKQWSEVVSATADGGYRMGNPEAPIKVIEYASLTCPHCAEFAEKGFPKLRDEYVASGRVSLELRNFIRDKFDMTMTLLTRCGSTESYFPLTEQTFAAQRDIFKNVDKLQGDKTLAALPDAQLFSALGEKAGLIDFFAARGIARDKARACLADAAKATALANGVKSAVDKYQIQGTPTFIVNGRNVDVATWEALEPVLKAAGAR